MVQQKLVGAWEQLEPLGEGGQSKVFLVRSPGRVQERRDVIQQVIGSNPWTVAMSEQERPEKIDQLAMSLWKYARPDTVSELGALKMFKIPDGPDGEEALGRLRNEISVLRQGKPGLVRLLEANERERWIVTEYMPSGTLEKHPSKYKGNAYAALRAFRTLVNTVASLHKENIVHRDIKPANVFLSDEDEQLVLGDFGIVFLPDQADRLTITNERVGPRDYMPQWGDLGERLKNPEPNLDVYMLGKLLWCMVSGRLKLPREYHLRREYDVTVLFRDDPNMPLINQILEKCVVEEPENCLRSAQELLGIVNESLTTLARGMPMLNQEGKLAFPCQVCGKGFYQEHSRTGGVQQLAAKDAEGRPISGIKVRIFVCNVCTHFEFFAPGFPDEAAKKGWNP